MLPSPRSLRLFSSATNHTTLFTSKNLRSHQTWKTDSPTTTPMMKMFHHFTRLLVLSAVFRWVRSRTTMYDCSSLTWERTSESLRTIIACQPGRDHSYRCVRKLMHTFRLQRVLRRLGLGDVDDPVDVEGDLLAGRAPVLVAEAVGVFAVVPGLEGVVAVGGGLLVDLVLAVGVGDL